MGSCWVHGCLGTPIDCCFRVRHQFVCLSSGLGYITNVQTYGWNQLQGMCMIHTSIPPYVHTYIPIHTNTCHCMPLNAIACHCMPLHAIAWHYMIACHYMPLHAITCQHMPVHISTYHYISFHNITCQYKTLHDIHTVKYIYIYIYTRKHVKLASWF